MQNCCSYELSTKEIWKRFSYHIELIHQVIQVVFSVAAHFYMFIVSVTNFQFYSSSQLKNLNIISINCAKNVFI